MKKLLFFSTLISTSLFLNAQTRSGNVNDLQKKQKQSDQNIRDDQQKGFRKENLRFGGNLGVGASVGDAIFVDISPTVGYQFTPRFQAGLGVIYNYLSCRIGFRDNPSDPWEYKRISMSIFGINPYAQFNVLQMPSLLLALRAEYGFLNYNVNFWDMTTEKREWVHYPMVGGSVVFPMGQSGGLSLQLMWDLNEKANSIYRSNPIIRMGFMFGL
jgi:hypothetical protein